MTVKAFLFRYEFFSRLLEHGLWYPLVLFVFACAGALSTFEMKRRV